MAENYFYAVVLGLALGVLLDIFRLFRLMINDKFFFDFFYWIISALCVFCYLLIFNNGEVRIIYILLIFSATVFYILTVGSLTKNAEIFISKKLRAFVKKVKKQLKSIYKLYYNKWVKRKNVKTTDDKGEVYDQKDEKKEQSK